MKTFICVFGAYDRGSYKTTVLVPLAIALNTANAKLATATAVVKLSEAYPEAMDNFNTDDPLISEHLDGSVCPTLDIFDENLLLKMSLMELNGNLLNIRISKTRNETQNCVFTFYLERLK